MGMVMSIASLQWNPEAARHENLYRGEAVPMPLSSEALRVL
jgi:hypothetical protein